MDATQERIYKIEQKLKDLSLELAKLKQTLPPKLQFSNEDCILAQLDKLDIFPPEDEQKKEEKAEESKEKPTRTESKAQNAANAEETTNATTSKKLRNKSSYKVIAIEYCQKMKLSKPIEVCTERKDWNICWDYLSPKGCSRHDCRWAHKDLNVKQRQIAKKGRKIMEATRFNAQVSIDEKSAIGEGSSKGNAIYDAYRKLISMIIPKNEAIHLLLNDNNKKEVWVKHPKSRLMEYAQRNNIPVPITAFSRSVDNLKQNTTIWKAKVTFAGKTVQVEDVRKKNAESKCCEKLLKMINIIDS